MCTQTLRDILSRRKDVSDIAFLWTVTPFSHWESDVVMRDMDLCAFYQLLKLMIFLLKFQWGTGYAAVAASLCSQLLGKSSLTLFQSAAKLMAISAHGWMRTLFQGYTLGVSLSFCCVDVAEATPQVAQHMSKHLRTSITKIVLLCQGKLKLVQSVSEISKNFSPYW